MNTSPYLLLWLEAPLQAWGHDSRFGRRESLPFPTKSGVLGLICCAMGKGGEQIEFLAQFSELDMQVVGYSSCDKQGNIKPGLPLLRDFHMVGSGYDSQDKWQSLFIPKTSEGKKAVGGGSKLTYRYYIQDMAFAVAFQIPLNLRDEIVNALQQPIWDLYLGRKCCVPTELIYQGAFDSLTALKQASQKLANQKNRAARFMVLQGEHAGETLLLNDIPLQFGDNKRYRERKVTVFSEMENQ